MTDTILYDCDGVNLDSGDILEPFDLAFLDAAYYFLDKASLWRVEKRYGKWQVQPQIGGSYYVLTQEAVHCCRVWPSPVTDIQFGSHRKTKL